MYVVTKKLVASKRKEVYFSCKKCLPTNHDVLADYLIDICVGGVHCEVCATKRKVSNG